MTWKSCSSSTERFLTDESGQDLVEYALVAVFVGMGAVAALKNVATGVVTVFASIGTQLTLTV